METVYYYFLRTVDRDTRRQAKVMQKVKRLFLGPQSKHKSVNIRDQMTGPRCGGRRFDLAIFTGIWTHSSIGL
jgi:hypothetical protein